MSKSKKILLLLAAGGMELSWLYALAAFLMFLTGSGPFPPLEALLTFLLAVVLTFAVRGLGWCVVYVLALHLLCFTATALWNVHAYFSWGSPFLRLDWLVALFGAPPGFFQTFLLTLVIFWSALFWIGGYKLVKRSTPYKAVTPRFDVGVTAFFLLFLVAGAAGMEFPSLDVLLFSFFLFSMVAIAFACNQDTKGTDYLAGYKGMGMLLAFAVTVLFLGAALVLLLLPYLTFAADASFIMLERVARPVGLTFARILLFIFGYSTRRMDMGPSSGTGENMVGGGGMGAGEGGWWAQLLAKVIGWGFLGLFGFFALVVAVWGFWFLGRWLFSRTPAVQEKEELQFWERLSCWFQSCYLYGRALFFSLGKAVVPSKHWQSEAVRLYKRLLLWGRSAGFPRRPEQTPREYGLYLGSYFPALKIEIESILECFNREIYGGLTLEKEELVFAKKAWRKLHSPFHWPSRLRARTLKGRRKS